jgi:hypothetical protein
LKCAVTGAAISRFHDVSPSETGASLPYSTPAAYYDPGRRHVKEREKLCELSRNNSATGRVPFPKSGEEVERTRYTRRRLPSHHQSAPVAPIHNSPPTTTPPTRLPARNSCPAIATEEMERERQRRRHQLNQHRTSETPATRAATSRPLPVPPRPPEVHTQRLAQPHPSVQSLKDAAKAHGAEYSIQRQPVDSERRSSSMCRAVSDRCLSIGKPQLVRSPATGSVKAQV